MNGHGKSDSFIVPKNLPNKGSGAPLSAEGEEGRGLTKGNPDQQNRFRTQRRVDLQHALDRIRQKVMSKQRSNPALKYIRNWS